MKAADTYSPFSTSAVGSKTSQKHCFATEIGDSLLTVVLSDALQESLDNFHADAQLVLLIASCYRYLHRIDNQTIRRLFRYSGVLPRLARAAGHFCPAAGGLLPKVVGQKSSQPRAKLLNHSVTIPCRQKQVTISLGFIS